MRNLLFILILLTSSGFLFAQVPGDTTVVQTFTYTSTTRDTVIQFPDNPAIQYEKVLMLYNMRCKNGLVSPPISGQTNIGCGEWDYSCNTYVTDSSRVDSLPGTRASHTISRFSGNSFPYVNSPIINRIQFQQTQTTATILNENQYTIGSGTHSSGLILQADKHSSRSMFIFTAAELNTAGLNTANIDALVLYAQGTQQLPFLKIRIQHTNLTAIDPANLDTIGFQTVYYNNTLLNSGANRLQFHTPFAWDGLSNIIIDFSITQSVPGSPLFLEADSIGNDWGVQCSDGIYVQNWNGMAVGLPATSLGTIQQELTVSFWSRGEAGLSTKNTSIIEGVDAQNRRQLNVHLPWSNTNIYFDCGNNGSAYDRINQLGSASYLENEWNHWAFTKNTTTGFMRIYLNGNAWFSGNGKTMPINLDSLVLMANINHTNPYYGDVDELTIWDKELTQTQIQQWMKRSITSAHPEYAHLMAYYKLDEAQGALIADSSVNAQTTVSEAAFNWRYTRGDRLHRFFNPLPYRPKISFLQGNYVLTNTTQTIYDSIPASPHLVRTYQVIPNPGTTQSDTYQLVSSQLLWHAGWQYTLHGETGAVIDSVAVSPVGTINVSSLSYIERYPSKYEIMSFVTPYGINLDLGMTGKTWTFDMTDYLPILHGKKRISIERGGQWQEDMDIKFLFLVGTPVREVKDIIQIWRQPANCNYDQISNDVFYEPRQVKMPSSAQSFKIRSMITGHGQEGEFIPRDHLLNINGGLEEFIWQVYKKCASNPVFPQGGTWIYDRTGWCPGMATDLKESDITPFVTPGQTSEIDYHMVPIVSPPVGNSNYLVTHQLVAYGPMNFSLDAAITDIKAPTNKIEYARNQAICTNPIIEIQNTGTTPLTSLKIEYWINQNTQRSVFNWTGNLAPLQKIDVTLSYSDLWVNVNSAENIFHVEIKDPNGSSDQYALNNKMSAPFTITGVVPSDVIVFCRTNSAGHETSYQVADEWGNVLVSRSGLANNTTYRDTLKLGFGCYQLKVLDSDEDGLSFFANSDGAGQFMFRRLNGTILKTFIPDFGAGFTYNFTVDYPLTYDQLYPDSDITVYPNPAQNQLFLEGSALDTYEWNVMNHLGQVCQVQQNVQGQKIRFDISSLSRGIYLLQGVGENQRISRRFVKE